MTQALGCRSFSRASSGCPSAAVSPQLREAVLVIALHARSASLRWAFNRTRQFRSKRLHSASQKPCRLYAVIPLHRSTPETFCLPGENVLHRGCMRLHVSVVRLSRHRQRGAHANICSTAARPDRPITDSPISHDPHQASCSAGYVHTHPLAVWPHNSTCYSRLAGRHQSEQFCTLLQVYGAACSLC